MRRSDADIDKDPFKGLDDLFGLCKNTSDWHVATSTPFPSSWGLSNYKWLECVQPVLHHLFCYSKQVPHPIDVLAIFLHAELGPVGIINSLLDYSCPSPTLFISIAKMDFEEPVFLP